jgi:hypothetical protein
MFAGAATAHARDKDEAQEQANAAGGFPELETK